MYRVFSLIDNKRDELYAIDLSFPLFLYVLVFFFKISYPLLIYSASLISY